MGVRALWAFFFCLLDHLAGALIIAHMTFIGLPFHLEGLPHQFAVASVQACDRELRELLASVALGLEGGVAQREVEQRLGSFVPFRHSPD